MKRTSAPWGEWEGWINPVARFSSMNLLRVASSSWTRSILDHRVGKCPHPEWFWDRRVNGQLICQPWIYRICLQSHGSLWEQYSCRPLSQKWSWSDQWPQGVRSGVGNNPSLQSCLHENMQLHQWGLLWGFLGFDWWNRFWNIWERVQKFWKCADDCSVWTEGELLDSCCDGC